MEWSAKQQKETRLEFQDTVIVVVGKDRTPFFLPRNAILGTSVLLCKMLKDGSGADFQVPTTRTIVLNDDKRYMIPDNFNTYANYITTGKFLPVCSTTKELVDIDTTYSELCDLWLLARYLEDGTFAVLAHSALAYTGNNNKCFPHQNIIARVWQELGAAAHDRKMFVELFLSCMKPDQGLHAYPAGFVAEYCQCLMEKGQ